MNFDEQVQETVDAVDLLEHLGTYFDQCEACQACFKRVAHCIAAGIDTEMNIFGKYPLNLVADHADSHDSGVAKHRRADEDFVKHSVRTAVRNGNVHSAAQLLRACDGDFTVNPLKWEEKDMCEVVASAARTFGRASTYCIAEDGKRLGDKKRENVVYEMWSAGPNKSMYLAPQDCSIGIV